MEAAIGIVLTIAIVLIIVLLTVGAIWAIVHFFLIRTINIIIDSWTISKVTDIALKAYKEGNPVDKSRLKNVVEKASTIPAFLWRNDLRNLKSRFDEMCELYDI